MIMMTEILYRREEFIFEVTPRPRLLDACVARVVKHINELSIKPDAIVGTHGCNSDGAVFAVAVAQQLQLPMFVVNKKPVSADGAVSVHSVSFDSRNGQV